MLSNKRHEMFSSFKFGKDSLITLRRVKKTIIIILDNDNGVDNDDDEGCVNIRKAEETFSYLNFSCLPCKEKTKEQKHSFIGQSAR